MVNKVSRFSSIKRAACFCFSKDKQQPDKTSKEYNNNKKKWRSNGHKSFIPIFNEPSSIEKILEDAERNTLLVNPPPPPSYLQEIAPPSPKSPFPKATTSSSSSRIADQQVLPKLVSSSVPKIQADNRGYVDDQVIPKVTKIQVDNIGYVDDQVIPKVTKIQVDNRGCYVDDQVIPKVTKIQVAYRGYVARRGYKALKGLVRLQGVTKSESVKKQIMNAMKTMQSFSKLQTEIRLLRIQILESKARQRQTQLIDDDDNNESVQVSTTTSLSKQPAQSNDWDDSVLSKHDRESRLQKKQEAILLKKKAMSYAAYTQQQQHNLNPHPNSHLPWWWNWIDHKLPLVVVPTNNSSDPPPLLKTDPTRASPMRYYYPRSRPSSSSAGARKFVPFPFNEDSNSLVSCPAFSSPHSHSQRHYMEQTASALAKVRPKSNPRQRMIPGRSRSPGTESSRRFSFPTTPISGSSKFKRESFEQHHKVDELSMGSPSSVTSRNILDRKPFNRFV